MNCTQCGTENNLNAKFCHKCGTSIQFESYNNEDSIKSDPVIYLMQMNSIANSIYANTNLYIEKLIELSRNFLKAAMMGANLNENIKNDILFLSIEFDKIINQLNLLKPPILEIENLHFEIEG